MNHFYLILVLVFFSCAQNPKKKESNRTMTPQEVVEITSEEESTWSKKVEDTSFTPRFLEAFDQLPLKNIPIVDSTSFDSFIDEDDIIPINHEVFSLAILYENWYAEGYNFRAISGYRLHLSPSFYTAVITVKKGDHEMESQLITYDLEGNFMDSAKVAYDEIAEGASRIQSQITQNQLIIDHIFWMDEKQVTREMVEIDKEGIIRLLHRNKTYTVLNEQTLIDTVIRQLGLHRPDMIVETSKIFPKSPQEAVVVLGELAHKDEEQEGVYELNSHIAILSLESGKITHTFFESSKTNGWVSDAVFIEDIVIDPMNYLISETKSAFGVIVKYRTLSQPNPYSEEILSLYTPENDGLKKILDHYTIYESTGEVDVTVGACSGEFMIEKNTMSLANSKTGDFFDIQVNTSHTQRLLSEDENGECQTQETTTSRTSRLGFNGKHYAESK
ncbi:MAG: hypothetical protein AAFP76_06460 [Bacteroidota bacterium]